MSTDGITSDGHSKLNLDKFSLTVLSLNLADFVLEFAFLVETLAQHQSDLALPVRENLRTVVLSIRSQVIFLSE